MFFLPKYFFVFISLNNIMFINWCNEFIFNLALLLQKDHYAEPSCNNLHDYCDWNHQECRRINYYSSVTFYDKISFLKFNSIQKYERLTNKTKIYFFAQAPLSLVAVAGKLFYLGQSTMAAAILLVFWKAWCTCVEHFQSQLTVLQHLRGSSLELFPNRSHNLYMRSTGNAKNRKHNFLIHLAHMKISHITDDLVVTLWINICLPKWFQSFNSSAIMVLWNTTTIKMQPPFDIDQIY